MDIFVTVMLVAMVLLVVVVGAAVVVVGTGVVLVDAGVVGTGVVVLPVTGLHPINGRMYANPCPWL